jgi:hypothetical protein
MMNIGIKIYTLNGESVKIIKKLQTKKYESQRIKAYY